MWSYPLRPNAALLRPQLDAAGCRRSEVDNEIKHGRNRTMKTTRKHILIAAALVGVLAFITAQAQESPVLQGTKDTRIGKIEFDLGFPSKDSVTKLYDELDFQRACQVTGCKF